MTNDEYGNSAIEIILALPDVFKKLEERLIKIEARLGVVEARGRSLSPPTIVASVANPPPTPSARPIEDDEDDNEVADMPLPPSLPVKVETVVQLAPEEQLAVSESPVSQPLTIPGEKLELFPDDFKKNCHIMGKLISQTGQALAGVAIKVLAVENGVEKVVKTTRSSPLGAWLAFLPPGEYTAEFSKPNMKSFLKQINVPVGLKKLNLGDIKA
jgi:hypothetical protein